MGTRVVVIGADKPVYNEATAVGAITPGMLVDRASATTVEANSIAGLTRVEVAVENDIFGGGIDNAYVAGQTVISQILLPGSEFMGLVAAADITAIVFDDFVTAAAGGYITKGTAANAIGRARSTSPGSTLARVRVVVQ